MPTPLERYRKRAGTGPGSTIGLEDWNGLIDEAGGILAALIKKGADFDAVATVAIGVLLDRINDVLGPAYDNVQARGAQVEALYARLSGEGVSADAILETADRLFWTAARAAALKADLLGDAPAGRQTLKALNDAIVANTATLSALTTGADPLIDTFAEVAAKFTSQGTALTEVMAAIGNRLRLDAAGSYSEAQKAQGRLNLLGAPIVVSASGAFAVADLGRPVRASGTITRTLPAASGLSTLARTDIVENNGTGIVTVAAAGTDPLDGVAGGTLILWPKQSAWFYLDTDGWRTVWVNQRTLIDRRKLTSTTLTADFTIPVGYPKVTLSLLGVRVITQWAELWVQLSDDGGATFKTGSADYTAGQLYGFAGTVGHATQQRSNIYLGQMNTGTDILGKLELDPGGGGRNPMFLADTFMWTQNQGYGNNIPKGSCNAISANRVTTIRLTTSGGGITAQSIALYGEPG